MRKERKFVGRRRRLLSAAVVAAAAVTVAVAGTGLAAAAPRATSAKANKSPIRIGDGETVIPGVYNSQATFDPGIAAALGYIGKHGGWGGRKVVLEHCTSTGDPASDLACFHQFAAEHVVATMGLLGSSGTVGTPLLSKAGSVEFMVPITSADLASPWEMALSPGTPGTYGAPARYACAHGYKRVSVLGDQVAQEEAAETQAYNQVYKRCGISVNYVTAPQGTPDLAPYIQKAVDTSPQLLLAAPSVPGDTLVSDIEQSGFPITKTIMVPEAEADFFSTPAVAGLLVEEAAQLQLASNPNPDVRIFRKDLREFSPGSNPFGQLSLEAYQDVIMLWQAAEAVGFSKMSGRAIEKYINTKAAGKLDIWAATPVTRTPGQPGVKGSYMAIMRVNAGAKLTQLGWWPALTPCRSKATCAKGVGTFTTT